MTGKIKANEYPLSKVFSSDFKYSIPPYQRPYSWTKDESGQLLEDLYTAYTSSPDNNYFIGSIVLIKKEDYPEADVVDGQQRLTTLSILFSALIKCLQKEEHRHSFIPYLKQPKDFSRNLEEYPRLSVRPKDRSLFDDYILQYDFEGLENIIIDKNKESQINIKQNALFLYSQLQNYFSTEDEFLSFGRYVVGNCFLVVVSAEDQESASRIFSVLNSRGLDLLPTDILKAEIIDKIPPHRQDEYTQKWENAEENLTRDGFTDLFYHIRMIYAKTKAEKALLEEFRKFVITKSVDSQKLIDEIIMPYANVLDKLTNKNFDCSNNIIKNEINFSCSWLNRIAVSDWKPVALAFCVKNQANFDYLNWFLKKLERLAAILFIIGATSQERITRFAEVLTEIEQEKDSLDNPLKSIELTENEKKSAISVLKGDIYNNLTWMRCKYIVMRTDCFFSDVPSDKYSAPIISIEHVLPQSMSNDWKKQWTEQEHDSWVNKIANLVLLSRRKNSQASNYDFQTKKSKYFASDSTSSFALTTQVLNESEWMPEIVSNRQKHLLKGIKKNWNL